MSRLAIKLGCCFHNMDCDDGEIMVSRSDEPYDLIIVGTGVVESLLSCFAAKNGKKVLHLDSNEYYGGNHASFQLSTMIKAFKPGFSNIHRCFVIKNDYADKQPIVDLFSSLNRWADNRGKIHMSYMSTSDNRDYRFFGQPDQNNIHPAWFNMNDDVDALIRNLKKDKDFTIDMSVKLLLGSGKFLEAMIESGVSNYLEFNPSGGIYFFPPSSNINQNLSWKIPLNKNDIFMSDRLSAMDKRSLVKFQQFVADYNRQKAGTDIKRLNEIELAKGRSLHRPQNKSEGSVNIEDKCFSEILNSFKLSPNLQSLINHVLCLQFSPNTASDVNFSLRQVATFLDAIGRYGDTAFLEPLYGVNEIVQGFCRMSAVWGTTFALRRGICEFSDNTDENTIALVDTEGETHFGKYLVLNCLNLPLHQLTLESWCVLHSIHFYEHRIFDESRSVAVIPPNYFFLDGSQTIDIGNSDAIFLTEKDCSTCTCPPGTFILHITTRVRDGSNFYKGNASVFEIRSAALQPVVRNLVDKVLLLLRCQSIHPLESTKEITYLEPAYQYTEISSRVHAISSCDQCGVNMESDYLQAESLWEKLFAEQFSFQKHSGNDETSDTIEDQENKEIHDMLTMLNV